MALKARACARGESTTKKPGHKIGVEIERRGFTVIREETRLLEGGIHSCKIRSRSESVTEWESGTSCLREGHEHGLL